MTDNASVGAKGLCHLQTFELVFEVCDYGGIDHFRILGN